MAFTSFFQSSILLLALVSFVSCGSQKPMVKDIQVQTSVVDNDVLLSLSADLAIGNLQLPNASFPIFIPNIGKEIGQINLVSTGNSNLLKVDLNLSETANLELAQVQLPNGSLIPLIADNAVLALPVGKATVYLGLSEGAQVIGVAIPIKTFDAMGAKVGTAALIPTFQVNGIVGAAGIYTSKTPGLNGFALIADISSVMGSYSLSSKSNKMQMEQARLDYAGIKTSRTAEKRINKELYKLNRRRVRLRLK